MNTDQRLRNLQLIGRVRLAALENAVSQWALERAERKARKRRAPSECLLAAASAYAIGGGQLDLKMDRLTAAARAFAATGAKHVKGKSAADRALFETATRYGRGLAAFSDLVAVALALINFFLTKTNAVSSIDNRSAIVYYNNRHRRS
jgi:D-alanyl-D-alanine carboxypeptidase